MSDDYKSITWEGAKHELRLYFRNGRTEAILILDKDGGVQPLHAFCGGDVGSKTCFAFDKNQHGTWNTIIKVDNRENGGTYFETCAIEIEDGCWYWTKDHFNNTPRDSFTFLRGVSADDLHNGVVSA